MTWILMLCTRKLVLAFIKLLLMLWTKELRENLSLSPHYFAIYTNCIPSLVKISQRMFSVEWSQGFYGQKSNFDLDPMTLKINRLPDLAIY